VATGRRVLAVFSDPDCPIARSSKRNLAALDNATVYTFLLPIASLHPQATRKAIAVWCAADRSRAWRAVVLERKTLAFEDLCRIRSSAIRHSQTKLEVRGNPDVDRRRWAHGRRCHAGCGAFRMARCECDESIAPLRCRRIAHEGRRGASRYRCCARRGRDIPLRLHVHCPAWVRDAYACPAPRGVQWRLGVGGITCSHCVATFRVNCPPGARPRIEERKCRDGDTGAIGNAIVDPDTAALFPTTRILKLGLVRRWEDRDGVLHDAAFVFVPIDHGHWLLDPVRAAPRLENRANQGHRGQPRHLAPANNPALVDADANPATPGVTGGPEGWRCPLSGPTRCARGGGSYQTEGKGRLADPPGPWLRQRQAIRASSAHGLALPCL